jgi:hypothetical protein
MTLCVSRRANLSHPGERRQASTMAMTQENWKNRGI